jgi:hypothetical protein
MNFSLLSAYVRGCAEYWQLTPFPRRSLLDQDQADESCPPPLAGEKPLIADGVFPLG